MIRSIIDGNVTGATDHCYYKFYAGSTLLGSASYNERPAYYLDGAVQNGSYSQTYTLNPGTTYYIKSNTVSGSTKRLSCYITSSTVPFGT